MCLALPGELLEIIEQPEQGARQGRISYDGVIKTADLAFTPEAQVGDYVIVHAGFAISVLDQQEAEASIKAFQELSELQHSVKHEMDKR
jgi:hydrogenase expression/formation protein HypC